MADQPIDLVKIASRLVDHEAEGARDAATIAVAVEKTCARLREDLTGVLGSDGFAALLGRALRQAKRDHPSLEGVAVEANSSACFTGLTESLATGNDQEAAAAGTSIVVHLLGLLVLLLGEGLGLQAARKIWPSVTSSIKGIDE